MPTLSTTLRLTALRALSAVLSKRIPTIFMYHSVAEVSSHLLTVEAACFEQQLQFLKDAGSVFLSMDALLDHLQESRAIPSNSVVITFDDGFRDNLTHALPILERFNVPATIYVATSYVEHGQSPTGIAMCSQTEIQELARHPLVTIGAHTHQHSKLTQLAPDAARSDIVAGRKILQDLVAKPLSHFAYPKGACSAELADVVRELGFRSAVTVKPGWIDAATDHMLLPRVPIDHGVPDWMFKKACGESLPYYESMKTCLGF